jgi:protein-S-isoprenylcysteine O-methyltransferase Ste14
MLFIGVTLGFVFAAAVPSAAIPGGLAAPAIGVCLMWGSVAFALWAQRTLGAMYRPIVAIQPNHAVVARGPYRLLRHPIYAAGIVVMAGIGLADGNWISLATCVVFAFLGYLRRIRVEERVLVEHLGEEYLDYERGRRRLIPGVW